MCTESKGLEKEVKTCCLKLFVRSASVMRFLRNWKFSKAGERAQSELRQIVNFEYRPDTIENKNFCCAKEVPTNGRKPGIHKNHLSD